MSTTTAPERQPQPLASAEPEQRFRELADRWRSETAHLSSVTKMSMHPAYQQIIGMGPAAIPLILQDLAREPDHWFWALTAITGEDPIPPEAAGRLDAMAEAWLSWGEHEACCEPD